MNETVIDIEFDDDDEMGACGYDKYRNDNEMGACGYDEYRKDNITIENQRDFDTFKRKANRGHSLITVDEYCKEDQLSGQMQAKTL
ncbi:hypothetical protein DPMN_163898 [Dreissena polymorpha]|uniref:Uncharacterized protein n=1 Tax=Dreissena polymorpha TaxID=45954 RepID=A0A9D4EU58_DREPO|nr:hypothetical protein DPMN_163898 [Dreissena polymorpha]